MRASALLHGCCPRPGVGAHAAARSFPPSSFAVITIRPLTQAAAANATAAAKTAVHNAAAPVKAAAANATTAAHVRILGFFENSMHRGFVRAWKRHLTSFERRRMVFASRPSHGVAACAGARRGVLSRVPSPAAAFPLALLFACRPLTPASRNPPPLPLAQQAAVTKAAANATAAVKAATAPMVRCVLRGPGCIYAPLFSSASGLGTNNQPGQQRRAPAAESARVWGRFAHGPPTALPARAGRPIPARRPEPTATPARPTPPLPPRANRPRWPRT